MMQPPNCPSCNAPLPPGALQCAYCKASTPLGVQQAHHQAHFAATAAAQRQRTNLSTVDFDYLDRRAGAAPREWSWLTSDRIRKVFEGGDANARADAVRDIRRDAGPLVVVYRAEDKIWPKVQEDKGIISDDFSYSSGEFLGALLVYNVDTGERLCQAKLKFESGEHISYKSRGMSSEKSRAAEAVEDDFKEQFENAATASIKRVAPDLRLGYKALE
jgi:hypothetical protein